MRFGIDLGTTRTVMAAVDRGNYPVVNVTDDLGDPHDFIPSVVALDGDDIIAGWAALADDSLPMARSFKRLMAAEEVTVATPVGLGDASRPLGEVLGVFAEHILAQLRRHQEQLGDDSPIEVVLGVPANALSAQRLLTLDAFTRAGARVLSLVNEPSAAAFEYSHRHHNTLNSRRTSIIVYDLGGGTFDATLIRIDNEIHDAVTSLGISQLGGDDFDGVLADLALQAVNRGEETLNHRERQHLLEETRAAKELLKPQSRRVILELGEDDVIVPVDTFYEAATPLVEQTLEALQPLIGHTEGLQDSDIAGIYLVGGASSLPLVPRLLREKFGRRVHRSPLPTASTAVGLAIAADPDAGYQLRDRMSRGIGVFRERDSGLAVSFDPLLLPGTKPDEDGVTRVSRRYWAAHNIGWFRFVEYSALDSEQAHPGDLGLIAEVLVPFDPQLRDVEDLASIPVRHSDAWPEVIETVTVDADGIASILIEVPHHGISVSAAITL